MNATNSKSVKSNEISKNKLKLPVAYQSTKEILHKQIDDFERDDSIVESQDQSGQGMTELH